MSNTDSPIDLLLLNASNYGGQPVFPYAFVQVSALARSRGLSTARFDLLGTPKEAWPALVASLIARHQPRMVGLHVRQVDSQLIGEYEPLDPTATRSDYFAADDTRALAAIVRSTSDVPIVVGGFGFSLHAERMFALLDVDYGVIGGPDAFFDAFAALAARDLSRAHTVDNLLFREGEDIRSGPRTFFGPLDAPEYDDTILEELRAFYSQHGVPMSQRGARTEADVPVEVMRGCPCRCYFCTEPSVKGRRVQVRDLDAIMADVVFLAERGIRVLWFICSELNMGGMSFPLALAERMRQFNTSRGERRVLWRAYAMPRPGMSAEQLAFMMSSGYLPGWNEFTSFDDENLRACRMPYRAADAVSYYKTLSALTRDPSIYLGEPPNKFEMFLGNAFMTPQAMRNTLEIIDREGFSQKTFHGDSADATRVYEIDGRLVCGGQGEVFSVGPGGRMANVDTLRPTFHIAPALLAALGDEARVREFIGYVSRVILTRNHHLHLDAISFFAEVTAPSTLAAHLAELSGVALLVTRHLAAARALRGAPEIAAADLLGEQLWDNPSEQNICSLWREASAPRAVRMAAARTMLSVISKVGEPRMAGVFGALSLEDPADRRTPYRIMRRLYRRFDSEAAILAHVRERLSLESDAIELFLLRAFLFTNGVQIIPAYRPLLFHEET